MTAQRRNRFAQDPHHRRDARVLAFVGLGTAGEHASVYQMEAGACGVFPGPASLMLNEWARPSGSLALQTFETYPDPCWVQEGHRPDAIPAWEMFPVQEEEGRPS